MSSNVLRLDLSEAIARGFDRYAVVSLLLKLPRGRKPSNKSCRALIVRVLRAAKKPCHKDDIYRAVIALGWKGNYRSFCNILSQYKGQGYENVSYGFWRAL